MRSVCSRPRAELSPGIRPRNGPRTQGACGRCPRPLGGESVEGRSAAATTSQPTAPRTAAVPAAPAAAPRLRDAGQAVGGRGAGRGSALATEPSLVRPAQARRKDPLAPRSDPIRIRLEPLTAPRGDDMVVGVRPTLRAAAVALTALVLGCGAAPARPVSGT